MKFLNKKYLKILLPTFLWLSAFAGSNVAIKSTYSTGLNEQLDRQIVTCSKLTDTNVKLKNLNFHFSNVSFQKMFPINLLDNGLKIFYDSNQQYGLQFKYLRSTYTTNNVSIDLSFKHDLNFSKLTPNEWVSVASIVNNDLSQLQGGITVSATNFVLGIHKISGVEKLINSRGNNILSNKEGEDTIIPCITNQFHLNWDNRYQALPFNILMDGDFTSHTSFTFSTEGDVTTPFSGQIQFVNKYKSKLTNQIGMTCGLANGNKLAQQSYLKYDPITNQVYLAMSSNSDQDNNFYTWLNLGLLWQKNGETEATYTTIVDSLSHLIYNKDNEAYESDNPVYDLLNGSNVSVITSQTAQSVKEVGDRIDVRWNIGSSLIYRELVLERNLKLTYKFISSHIEMYTTTVRIADKSIGYNFITANIKLNTKTEHTFNDSLIMTFNDPTTGFTYDSEPCNFTVQGNDHDIQYLSIDWMTSQENYRGFYTRGDTMNMKVILNNNLLTGGDLANWFDHAIIKYSLTRSVEHLQQAIITSRQISYSADKNDITYEMTVDYPNLNESLTQHYLLVIHKSDKNIYDVAMTLQDNQTTEFYQIWTFYYGNTELKEDYLLPSWSPSQVEKLDYSITGNELNIYKLKNEVGSHTIWTFKTGEQYKHKASSWQMNFNFNKEYYEAEYSWDVANGLITINLKQIKELSPNTDRMDFMVSLYNKKQMVTSHNLTWIVDYSDSPTPTPTPTPNNNSKIILIISCVCGSLALILLSWLSVYTFIKVRNRRNLKKLHKKTDPTD